MNGEDRETTTHRASREPRVSALMVAKNRADTLKESAQSVLAQGFSDLELLIVDDSSTDATYEQALVLATGDPRVRVLRNTGPPGIPEARNAGIKVARGTYLAICDSDDLSRLQRFEIEVAALDSDPGLVGVGSAINCFTHRPADGFKPNWRWGLTSGRGPFPFPSALLRTAAVRAVGGLDPKFAVAEDLDLCYRLAGAGGKFLMLPDVLVDYRFDGQGSMSVNPQGDYLTLLAQWRGLKALRGRFTPAGYVTLIQSVWRLGRARYRNRFARREAK